ncbi:unnamed protein product [Closterium sp. NIES-65]|nr:unnamed protein product [Closterium sp. NIES-65]
MLASLMLRQVGGGTVGSLATLPSVPCIRHFHAPHHSVDHNLLHLTSTSPPLLHPSPPSPAVCHCHFHCNHSVDHSLPTATLKPPKPLLPHYLSPPSPAVCHCYAPHHSVNHSLLHLTSTSPPLLQNPPSPLPLLLSCKTPHLPSLSPSLATLPPAVRHCHAPNHSVDHGLPRATHMLYQNPPPPPPPPPPPLSCIPPLHPLQYAIAMLPITVWITVFLSRLNMAI